MLSVILPTYNESENIRKLIPAIQKALHAIPHEIIVVDDDSPDETWKVAYEFNVRIKRRRDIRGLASAVVEGFNLAKGDVFMVMDADGQHDPALLPKLYAAVMGHLPLTSILSRRERKTAIAIASRYIKGGSVSDWRRYRLLGSCCCTYIARVLCPREVTDPLSGYFAMERSLYESIREMIRPTGFKILFEIVAHLPPGVRIMEVPLRFGVRSSGKSKLSFKIQLQFFMQVLRLIVSTTRGQFRLFGIILLVIGLVIVPRLWSLRLLYINHDVRVRVQERIEDIAEEQGWLLSDVSLNNVTRESVRILYRSHIRGSDPEECFMVNIDSSTLTPCSDS